MFLQINFVTTLESRKIFDRSFLTSPSGSFSSENCFAGEILNLSLSRVNDVIEEFSENSAASCDRYCFAPPGGSEKILIFPIEYSDDSKAFQRALSDYSNSQCSSYTIDNIFLYKNNS